MIKIENENNIDIPRPKNNEKEEKPVFIIGNFFKYYLPIFLVWIVDGGLLYLTITNPRYDLTALIIITIISIPLLIFSTIFFIIRLILDMNDIKGGITILFSNRYLITYTITNTGRFLKKVIIPSRIGETWDKNKEETYIIDGNVILSDEKKRPVHLYFENVPTPFKPVYSENSYTLKYSAETYKKSMRDKLLNELHGEMDSDTKKLIMILLGVIIFLVIAIIVLVFVFISKSTGGTVA